MAWVSAVSCLSPIYPCTAQADRSMLLNTLQKAGFLADGNEIRALHGTRYRESWQGLQVASHL